MPGSSPLRPLSFMVIIVFPLCLHYFSNQISNLLYICMYACGGVPACILCLTTRCIVTRTWYFICVVVNRGDIGKGFTVHNTLQLFILKVREYRNLIILLSLSLPSSILYYVCSGIACKFVGIQCIYTNTCNKIIISLMKLSQTSVMCSKWLDYLHTRFQRQVLHTY